jgi:hypothetical protein
MSGLLFHNLRGISGSFQTYVPERLDISKIISLKYNYRYFRILHFDYPHQLYIKYPGLVGSYWFYTRYHIKSELDQDVKDIEKKMKTLEEVRFSIQRIHEKNNKFENSQE